MNRKVLATAVAAALCGAAAPAFAAKFGVSKAADAPNFAQEGITAGTTVTMPATPNSFTWEVEGTDIFVGRTTGFNLTMKLDGGVKFAAGVGAVTVTPSTTTCQVVSGGASGDTFVKLACQPPTAAPGLGAGTKVSVGGIRYTNTSLGGGTPVTGTAQLEDANVGLPIGSAASGILAASASGVKVTVAAGGSSSYTVDVTAGSKSLTNSAGTFAPVSGSSTNSTGSSMGTVNFNVDTTLLNPTTGAALVPADLSAISASVSGYAFDAYLKATSGNNVGVWLATATCATPPAGILTPAANASASAINFPSTLSIAPNVTYNVCFNADGATAIASGQPTVALTGYTLNGTNVTSGPAAKALSSFKKNGFTATFPTAALDPNYTMYVSVNNASSVAGDVFMTVYDYSGAKILDNKKVGSLVANGGALYDMRAVLGVVPNGLGSIQVSTTTPTASTQAQLFLLQNATGAISNVSASK